MPRVVELPVTDQGSAAVDVGFFDDDLGHRSSMRLMSMVALLTAIPFGTVSLLAAVGVLGSGGGGGESITITFGFLVAAFAPKAVQKFAEAKLPTGR